ncbi:MAG: cytochrome c maturation protein CcmE [Fimbriimonas ginsengisoli]|uniref:Cytochrome c maturation protein CcmE n=1 Tax=Fimbriimonas ginsengisoli TaxID=1005039 RepID=A0A931LWI5_FIMGI|nr:cytochrome c maturation protein CcmE [Fimbriimonas ginsengisoli]
MNSSNRRSGQLHVVTAIIVLAGLAAIIFAFVSNASPYGTFADARRSGGNSIHVAGELLKETLDIDARHGILRFAMKDEKGEQMTVEYTGAPPSSLSEATRVVAIGGVKNGVFHSDKLLLKCPSRYEAKAKTVKR